MRRIWVYYSLVLCMLTASSCTDHKETNPVPLLMIEEYGGLGSSRHNFVSIYSDGTVIFLRQSEHETSEYKSAKVSSATALIAELGADALPKDSKQYELSYATDQPMTRIWHRGKSIRIYGNWRAPPRLHAGEDNSDAHEIKLRESFPSEVKTFCTHVDSFNPDNSTNWHPETIRITLEKTDYPVGNNPVTWPPDLPSPKTSKVTQHEYGLFSFDISYQFMDRVDEVRNEMRHGRALVLDGTRCNLWVRWVIPGQDIWERDFEAAFGHLYP